MEIVRSKTDIIVSQRKYVLDLLKETRMLGCKPSDTLMEIVTKDREDRKNALIN